MADFDVVFKVVRDYNYALLSSDAPHWCALRYGIEIVTEAIPGTGIFCFDRYMDARRYRSFNTCGTETLVCYAYEPVELPEISLCDFSHISKSKEVVSRYGSILRNYSWKGDIGSKEWVSQLWEESEEIASILHPIKVSMQWPLGTVCYKRIKPIEILG